MSFAESADSLRAKLHLTDAKAASIAGVVVVALAIAAAVAGGVAALMPASAIEIVKPAEAFSAEQAETDAETDVLSVYVHVTGAVANPGMYEVADGARVQDAVEAAGGFSDDAADGVLNLARVVADGEQIVVPSLGDVEDQRAGSNAESGEGATGSATGTFSPDGSMVGGRVNINAASAEQLDALPGIGQATAEKIVADREAHGPFASAEDLQRVSGIGAKKFAQLEDLVCVG